MLERADEHVDAIGLEAEVLGDAAARLAERAEGERLVDDQVAAVGVTQPEQRGQVRQ